MAESENIGNLNVAGAYQHSFGNIPNGTTYVQVDMKSMNSVKYSADLRPALNEATKIGMKALNTQTGGPGTAGYALIPIYVDPDIIDQTRKYTPLVELIPRVTNMGITADYNVITAKGGAFVQAEDGSLVETNTTFDRKSVPIKWLYSVGRVTGQSIASMPSYVLTGMQPTGGATGPFGNASATNAKQMEILVKTREIRELEESLIIGGDTGSDPNEFDGIVVTMGTTNTVDKVNTAVGLTDIDKSIKKAFDAGGRPNLGVCDSSTYTDVLGLLTAKIGYLQSTQQVFWGFSTIVLNTMVGQVPLIPSMFLDNTTGNKSVYFLDMSVVQMRVLQDLTYEDLAKTNDSEKFMLKIYEALVIKNPAFCSSITNIL